MSRKLIKTINGQWFTAKIYKDSDTQEFVVRYTDQNGEIHPEADYFTNDKADAIATAEYVSC